MTKSAPILVADDEKNDIFFLRRAFQKAGLTTEIFEVPDGEQAEKYLAGEELFSDRNRFPMPYLLLLDIKMPKRDGFDVLKWLQGRTEFKDLTVVMLSSSSQDSDIRKARELGARDYFVKPSDFDQLTQVVQTLAERWLNLAI
jgi:CheY-like chemotaxis protein